VRQEDYLKILGIIVLIAACVRFLFLLAGGAVIDSDEAIVGLMARDILHGRPWPIFYYGQNYMGSLEAILSAGIFALLGREDGLALKVVPLICSLWFVVAIHALTRRFASEHGAQVAALLAAVPPLALVEWSTKARGGFIELVLLGTVSLILAVDIVNGERLRRWRCFWLGVLLGLSWWVNNQAIFYLAAIGVTFAVALPRRFGLRAALSNACIMGGAFILGGAPFWWANLFHEPSFATFAELGHSAQSPGQVLDHLGGYFREALPILLGARRFWQLNDQFPGSTVLTYLIYGIVLALGLAAHRRGSSILFIMLIIVPVIFAASRFGWLTQAPRYLLPLYSVIFPLVGIAVASLQSRLVATFLPVGLIILNLCSMQTSGALAIPGQPFVASGQRVQSDQSALYLWLAEHGYRHIFTNYWIGYRVAFETGEQVTFSIYGEPRSRRVPRYELIEPAAASPYVLVPSQVTEFSVMLAALGYRFRSSDVNGYVVVDQIRPLVSPGAKVDLHRSQISATSRPDWTRALIDGDLGTRWGSGRPQATGMEIELRLAQSELVSNIVLWQGLWPQDAARSLTVEIERADGSNCTIFDGPMEHYLPDTRGRLQLNFPPERIVAVRLFQQGNDAIFDWSLAEIELFTPGDPDLDSARALDGGMNGL